jgi:acyl dehydratase
MHRLLRIAARSAVGALRREPPVLPAPGTRLAEWVPAVEPRTVRRYLRAIEGDVAGCTGGAVPALLPTIWEPRLLLGLLAAEGVRLPPGPVIHAGSERTLLRRLATGRVYRAEAMVEECSWGADGGRLSLVSRVRDEPGRICFESRLRLRLPRGRGRAARPSEEATLAWTPVAEGAVTLAHARGYARLSGDWNPIHLSRVTAAPFGFPRPVLHGSVLEGWVAWRLGSAATVRQLEIRFRRPVLLPDRLQLERPAGGRFRVRSVTRDLVVAEGIAHPSG